MFRVIRLLTGNSSVGIMLTVFSLLVLPSAHSAARHALVIGNSEYGDGFALVNPLRDSTAIAEKLNAIGYTVHGGGALRDLGIKELNNQIDSFLSSVEDGASTLIYYAGHGAASGGLNYLIPILPEGVTLRSESDIRERSLSLQSILERVERVNPSGVNVLFFDACRDAPVDNFTRTINLSGLVSMDTRRQPRGSFVGFSTEYGKLALDGTDTDNSPFAGAFLNALDSSASSPIELFYKKVTEAVYDETAGQQFPIQETKLRGEHCIIECRVISKNAERTQEFGYLTVDTTPVDAEVCFMLNGWKSWNCENQDQVALPLNKDVMVRVAARGYKTFTTSTSLNGDGEILVATLRRKNNRTLFIVGGVAAAVVVGGLLLSGGDDNDDEVINIQLTPP